MKKLIVMMLVLPMLFASCSKGDEVWGLYIGQSRDSVIEQLKQRGLTVEDSDGSYVSIDSKVDYQGIQWDAVTCWFDKSNSLKSIEFATYGNRPSYQLEKLMGYIKNEGYPEFQDDATAPGFHISDKLPMSVMLTISSGYGGIRLHYCKDAHKKGE